MRKSFYFIIIVLLPALFLYSYAQTQISNNLGHCGFERPPFLTDHNITVKKSLSHIPYTNYFSLKSIENIYINLIPKRDMGLKVITLVFYDPNGNIYLKKKVPIKSSESITKNNISIPGYRFLQKVKGGKILKIGNLGKRRVIPIPFAISGTYISNNHMTGTWEVKIFVNNNENPCYNIFFTIGD